MIYIDWIGNNHDSTRYAVQDIATGSGVVTVGYPTDFLGGTSPKAALMIGTQHAISNDPGETANAQITIAARDSSVRAAVTGFIQDNVASTNTVRYSMKDGRTYRVLNSAGTTVESGTGQLIRNGLQVDWDANDAADRRAAYAAFAGTDLQVKVDVVAMGTASGDLAVSVGFEPDAVIVFGSADSTPVGGNLSNGHYLHFGIAVNNGDGTAMQRCVVHSEIDGGASGRPQCTLSTDAVVDLNTWTDGSFVRSAALEDLSSTGFNLNRSSSFSSTDVCYLALKLGERRRAKLVDFDSPTSAGSFSITGAGFTPSFAIAVTTSLEAVDAFTNTDDTKAGFGICLIGNEQWSSAIRSDSAADPTDTASQCSNVALMGPSATDCDAFSATFTSWDSDGATFNATAVHGTAKKCFILFLE